MIVMKVKVSAFDSDLLDKCVGEILSVVFQSGGIVNGPIPLPTKHKRYVLNRSPHIDKKSREVLYLNTHTRAIYITTDGENTMQHIKDINIPNGIGVTVKIVKNIESKSRN
ncbi:30S ribosomal protein S10 [Candidatus Deianiraea vastatrix]|uniref:Small ribosomal subunit protein uS10 n=1 Tax=Candidatus Deianiraea vastatrix TaxID=2163644 RepID=A0A5B8XC65_9RICK|nr:30S ribosomal protein S10 [Candidatus Deianiraea vastatrix]QED22932.1 30S ribosomal protein S10 [Candidatus Deianiraea vastatrix]